MSVYVTGDTHHDFSRFEEGSGAQWHTPPKEGDYLIICGDFGGVWDGSGDEQKALDKLNEKPFMTLWVDGNHENYDLLARYPISDWHGGKVQFIRPRVIHLLRGYVYDIDGRSFFTMGGASSHDMQDGLLEPDDPDQMKEVSRLLKEGALFRINHISWWKEELPSPEEYARADRNLAACGHKVDYIITHDAPASIQEGLSPRDPDELNNFLEKVKESTDFRYWLFGHHHTNGRIEDKYIAIYDQIVELL